MLAGKRNSHYFIYFVLLVFIVIINTTSSFAHHGGVSTAFGPGAPIETASPLALGKGNFLLYEKFEYVPFEHKDHAQVVTKSMRKRTDFSPGLILLQNRTYSILPKIRMTRTKLMMRRAGRFFIFRQV